MNKLVRNIAIGITTGVVTYHVPLMHHTVLLKQYRTALSLSQNGEMLWPTASVGLYIKNAIDDLKLPEYSERMIPFVSCGFDIFHAGTTFYKYGFIIGLPMTYANDNIESIDTSNIKVNREHVDWNSKHGQNLLKSLILSDDAKQYAIAHELLRVHNNETIINAMCGAIIVTATWFASCIASYKLKKHNVQKPIRILTHSLIGILGISSWIAQRDFYTNYLDNKIDKTLAEIGPQYVKGGKEYYDKLVNRNICLRHLSGECGKKLYTATGNYYTFVRQKCKPLTHRRSFFESLLKEENIQS